MILVAGVLNIDLGHRRDRFDSTFFVDDAKYIFSDLNTMGWIVLVIGVVQLFAAFSIWQRRRSSDAGSASSRRASNADRRAAVDCRPTRSGRSPCSRIDLLIIYGLAAYGGQRRYAA